MGGNEEGEEQDEGSGTEKTRAMLGSLASGMVSIFSVQLMSRILTFALNIMIARSVDRKVYGIGSVQMGLVCDAVLALSREGFRDACQRTPARDWQDAKSRGRVLAVAWLCVPFAAFVGIVVWNVSSYFGSGQEEGGVSAAGISATFIAAAGLEMLSEPLYILAHNMLLINIRVRVEIFALVSRVVTTSTLITLYPETPLRAFALGQISYGAAMLAGFSAYFSLSQQGLGFRETFALLSGWRSLSLLLSSRGHAGGRGNEAGGGGEVPGGGGGGRGIDMDLVVLVCNMSFKALLKFVLEKGEMMVLLGHFSAETWAMYGLVQNLASLVVRLVFFPLEDMSQLAFSKLLSSNLYASAAEVFAVLVKLVVIVGATAAAFGPGYSFTVVHLLYGSRWSRSEMPVLLSWYSTYILFLALNGVTEAFVHASASGAQMRQRSLMLLPIAAANLSLSCLFAPYFGARALIAGNCISMSLRIVLSLRHTSSFFASKNLPQGIRMREHLPCLHLIICLASCGVATSLADSFFIGGKAETLSMGALVAHVAAAILCLSICFLVQLRFDRAFPGRVKQLVGARSRKAA